MEAKLAPWKGTTQQVLIGLAMAMLIVAVIEANSDYEEDCGWGLVSNDVNYYSRGGDGHRIRIGRGRCRIDLRLRGEVDFAPDNRSVARIGPESSIEITHRVKRERRRLRVEPGDGGEPEYTWHVNRLPEKFDDEARAWLAGVLPQIYRSTGLDADGRVAQLWAAGGFEAVMGEMQEIRRDYVRGLYLQELSSHTESDEQRVRVFDYTRREISSDHERAKVITALDTEILASDEVRTAWLAALKSIDTDWQLHRVLAAVWDEGDVNPEVLDTLLQAARTMGSDHEQAAFLISVAKKLARDQALPASYFQALKSIGSDHDHKRTLSAALSRPELSAAEAAQLLETASRISGDFELAELLTETARNYPHDRRLPEPFFAAMESLDSASSLRRVLGTVVEHRDMDPATTAGVLGAAASLSADFELSSFLVKFLETYPRKAALPDGFQSLVDALDSEYERDKVTAALVGRGGDVSRDETVTSP